MGIDVTMHRTTKLTIAKKEFIRSGTIEDTFMTLTIKGVNSDGEQLEVTFFTNSDDLDLTLEEE